MIAAWSIEASASTIIPGLLVLAGIVWFSFQNWTRGGRRKPTLWLEVLRVVIAVAIFITLLKPEHVREIPRTELPVIAVLEDRSASMSTSDTDIEGKFEERAAWIESVRNSEAWSEPATDALIKWIPFPDSTDDTPDLSRGTDIEATLSDTIQRESNLKAVLMLTDGDWNSGRSPIGAGSRYQARGIPVYSIAIGRETPLPDVDLAQVDAPSYGLFGEQIAIPFRVANNLPRALETEVILEHDGVEVSRKPVTLEAMSEATETALWYPRATGVHDLRLRVPIAEGEALADNNLKEFQINVRVETLKVLVVDSRPRWEYRYLRNALERDPGVEMHCLLFHPGIGVGGGRHYLSAFPSTRDAISRYDVVFLGDVGIGPDELTEEQAELLAGLVEQQASGLVFIAGQRGRIQSFIGSPLEDLLPVQLEPERPTGIPLQNETPFVLTELGKRHLLTRFDSDAEQNGFLWERLPGFFWSSAVVKNRPGTEVLAVHGSIRNEYGRLPLLVTKNHGAGKILFMGTDSAWRWRRGVEDKFHYRLWSQVVRWMAHRRHLAESDGIRVTFSPEAPQAGDTVYLQASVLDAAGFPLERGNVTAIVRTPSGGTERITLDSVEGGWGVFEGTMQVSGPGDHAIEIKSVEAGRTLELELPVMQPIIEKIGQPTNPDILNELARVTGGRSGGIESFEEILGELQTLPEPQPFVKRTRLWSHPLWGLAILTLLGIYWTGRKLAGMI